jgi:hypothetical protein
MRRLQISGKTIALLAPLVLAGLLPRPAWTGNIDDVIFLKRIEVYETTVSTTLVTQEGKRIPIAKGTRLNIAGFDGDEALVISRTDRPNGFVWRDTIAPIGASSPSRPGTIKEETLD